MNDISRRVSFVRYDKNSSATKDFSQYCDARLIWGGDHTLSEVRKHPTHSRSIDVCFADRVSICIIDALSFLNAFDQTKIINGFYNDTYLFDQNACTAPKLVIWRGTTNEICKAKALFWDKLFKIVKNKYELSGVMSVDKRCSLYEFFIKNDNVKEYINHDNLIYRIQLSDLDSNYNKINFKYGIF